ncbi:MerR family transcriptional regulator [Desulfitobacterium sp. Sab5]|uniref:MerR family transcriptional regulator n=1 Tax=Desulfitobacterium nosdiversum TaxID=3375356 RepID=UPI003CEC8B21
MKISEVMKITTLTKKAINYYEEEGLIKPQVNPENNYREYSQSDVDKLVQISVLRQLDVPIKLIKDIIVKPEMLKDKLEQHLISINDKINRLGKSKNIIMSCLKSTNDSNIELTKHLLFLNKCLEMDDREREGFMKRQLKRIFPGNFGKMLVIHYAPFLNSPIDTKEKEDAWLNLVEFLDEVESIEYPEEMKEIYKNLTDEDMEKYENVSIKNAKKWIGIKDEELLDEKKQFLEFIERLNSDADMQSSWQKTFRIDKTLKEQMKNINYYEKFTENLKILSEDYCEYTNAMNNYIKLLNVKVDDKGKIEFAD